MLGKTYDIEASPNKLNFMFISVGFKGSVVKMVVFQPQDNKRFNLGFGDFYDNAIHDAVVTNNGDVVKVLATVAKCAYEFIESHQGAILEIKPVDEGRRMLYNTVFKRHYLAISKKFEVKGAVSNEEPKPYSPEIDYDEFELCHKI